MIVGGPNNRDDFHIQTGEELFFQIKGDMDLDVFEKNKTRIQIKEGSIFLLPHNIPHSPQRYDSTIGLVIERTRSKKEIDHLRWYNSKGTIIYNESFYCENLGTQLKPI